MGAHKCHSVVPKQKSHQTNCALSEYTSCNGQRRNDVNSGKPPIYWYGGGDADIDFEQYLCTQDVRLRCASRAINSVIRLRSVSLTQHLTARRFSWWQK